MSIIKINSPKRLQVEVASFSGAQVETTTFVGAGNLPTDVRAAYAIANSAISTANNALNVANGSIATANAALVIANNASTTANAALVVANNASTTANAAIVIANNASNLANSVSANVLILQAVDSSQNLSIQAAFNKANAALANTTGIFGGDLTVSGNLIVIGVMTGNNNIIDCGTY